LSQVSDIVYLWFGHIGPAL